MAEVVLVVLGSPETAPSLLAAGENLARLLGGARLNALAAEERVHLSALRAETLISQAEAVVAANRRERERIAALKRVFDDWAAHPREPDVVPGWIEVEGSLASAVAERGCRADFIVAGQPPEGDRVGWRAFRAALFGTDRPVLRVPIGWSGEFGRCIAIAYREEKTAKRALLPALRCLAGAERVCVLMGLRETLPRPAMPKILLEHGIGAELRTLPIGPGPFGQVLLDAAHQAEADLLVMGAYAHSPLRELILGGVTRYMLAHADLPVLMRH